MCVIFIFFFFVKNYNKEELSVNRPDKIPEIVIEKADFYKKIELPGDPVKSKVLDDVFSAFDSIQKEIREGYISGAVKFWQTPGGHSMGQISFTDAEILLFGAKSDGRFGTCVKSIYASDKKHIQENVVREEEITFFSPDSDVLAIYKTATMGLIFDADGSFMFWGESNGKVLHENWTEDGKMVKKQ
jgi:hypothetical protein